MQILVIVFQKTAKPSIQIDKVCACLGLQLGQIASLQQLSMQSTRNQGQKLAMRQTGGDSKAVVINGLVKEFVINTIDMVKNNIHEEEDIIDHMLELLQKNMSMICHKPSEISQKSTVNTSTIALQRIESAVQQLNKDSDLLSERIFDLSQSLIQKRLQQVQQQKKEMQRLYENKIFRMKSQYQKQRNILQSQLRHYQEKCSALEECLELREGKQDHHKRQELSRYLQVIEEIYGELEILKNFSSQPSNQTDPHQYSAPPKVFPDNYSEQYYNVRKEERSTQAGSQQRRLKSPSNYNYVQYQNAPEIRYYQLKEGDSERREVERRANSKSKPLSPRYVQIPLPQQSYYIKSEGERRERSRSTGRDKREGNSNYKVRPIILHYQTPQVKSPAKESQAYTRRSLKLNNEQEFKRIEQKNVRMQGVQQKLQELKRKLERELKTMKS